MRGSDRETSRASRHRASMPGVRHGFCSGGLADAVLERVDHLRGDPQPTHVTRVPAVHPDWELAGHGPGSTTDTASRAGLR
jgi:hypothetical protein